MRKAFTLVELIVSIVFSLVFMTFCFVAGFAVYLLWQWL